MKKINHTVFLFYYKIIFEKGIENYFANYSSENIQIFSQEHRMRVKILIVYLWRLGENSIHNAVDLITTSLHSELQKIEEFKPMTTP